jgi:hypothetical protein
VTVSVVIVRALAVARTFYYLTSSLTIR